MEWHDQALCAQNLDTNESPRTTYLKNLCCDECEILDPPKRDLTNVLLASIIPGIIVLLAIVSAYFLFRRRAARLSIRETKEGKIKHLFMVVLHIVVRGGGTSGDFIYTSRKYYPLTKLHSLPDFARQSISTNQYTYKELKSATQKFHKDKKLGEGGFGEVYQVRLLMNNHEISLVLYHTWFSC